MMEANKAGGHPAHHMVSWLEEAVVAIETTTGSPLIPDDKDVTAYFQIRSALVNIYPVFIMMNVVVFVVAVPANIFLIIKILTTNEIRHSRVLHFMINAALCDLFKLVFVLPITLANLLLQNFVFGAFVCYTLPMLQVFPIHTSVINYAGLIYDRYRGIRYPDKKRSPVVIFTVLSWILAFCSVLPYAGVIRYLDLEEIRGPAFANLGICLMDVDKDIENYLRVSFFLLFFIPSLFMAILLIKTASELTFQRKAVSSCSCYPGCVMWEQRESRSLINPQTTVTINGAHFVNGQLVANGHRSLMQTLDGGGSKMTIGDKRRQSGVSDHFETSSIGDVDCPFCASELQRQEQTRIIWIASLFIAFWTPATLFIFVMHFIPDKVADLADLMSLILTFVGFLSTTWNAFLVLPMITQRVQIHQTCKGGFTDDLLDDQRLNQNVSIDVHVPRKSGSQKSSGNRSSKQKDHISK